MAEEPRLPGEPGAGTPDGLVAAIPRVRLSLRTALVVVVALAATVLALEIARDAERVLAWMFASMAVAAMLFPIVGRLSRVMPRVLAVLLVVVAVLGSIGFVAYHIVDDVRTQTAHLQDAAPARAAQLERSSDFLREIQLQRRVKGFVNQIPKRLAGGDAAAVVRSAASRGVAFLANLILTIFFVLYGPRLLEGGFEQIRDEHRRRRVETVFRGASRRTFAYTRVKVLDVVALGFIAFIIGRAAGVPGPAALAVWVALWALVPVAGLVIGALPIIVFAGATSVTRAVVVAVVFALVGLVDWLLNRQLQRTTVKVGSFAIVLAGFAGLELYGLLGALLFVLGAVFLIAVVTEIGPEEVAEVIVAPLAGATEDEPATS